MPPAINLSERCCMHTILACSGLKSNCEVCITFRLTVWRRVFECKRCPTKQAKGTYSRRRSLRRRCQQPWCSFEHSSFLGFLPKIYYSLMIVIASLLTQVQAHMSLVVPGPARNAVDRNTAIYQQYVLSFFPFPRLTAYLSLTTDISSTLESMLIQQRSHA